MKFVINIYLIALAITLVSCVEEFPSHIERCKHEDDVCMLNAWNKYIKLAESTGIPELSLPHSHKTFIEKLVVQVGSKDSPLNLKVAFKNINVTGMATSVFEKVTGFKKDPKMMTQFTLKGFVPYMNIRGTYQATGKLLLFQINGNGIGEMEYYNTTFLVTVNTKTEVRNGEEYLVISKVRNDYETERYHFDFKNLINNQEINENIMKILNANQDVMKAEVNKPSAISFAKIFKEILTPIFERYPYRSFYLD